MCKSNAERNLKNKTFAEIYNVLNHKNQRFSKNDLLCIINYRNFVA